MSNRRRAAVFVPTAEQLQRRILEDEATTRSEDVQVPALCEYCGWNALQPDGLGDWFRAAIFDKAGERVVAWSLLCADCGECVAAVSSEQRPMPIM